MNKGMVSVISEGPAKMPIPDLQRKPPLNALSDQV